MALAAATFLTNILVAPRETNSNPDYFPKYYLRSYARAPVYFVGIALGWIVYQSRKPDPLRIEASERTKKVSPSPPILIVLSRH